MDQDKTIDGAAILEAIRKEHQSTRMVFGISIIILALILTVLAPIVIRMSILNNKASHWGNYGDTTYIPQPDMGGMKGDASTTPAATTTQEKSW